MKYVFFLNMGGVNSLDECELFLKNMFNDPAILRINPIFRKILSLIIRKSRLKQMKQNYAAIGGKSPLSEISSKLCKRLNAQSMDIKYDFCSLYVPPFAKDVFAKYTFTKEDEILLFPLYPQFSTTTTKPSIKDALSKLLLRLGSKKKDFCFKLFDKGEFDFAKRGFCHEEDILLCGEEIGIKKLVVKGYFYQLEGFNSLLVRDLKDANERFLPLSKKTLILSAHSLPVSIIKAGDVYEKQINEQVSLLKSSLASVYEDIILSYQSKLGPVKWLGPSTQECLQKLDNEAVVYPLSFCIDCSESVFELDIEYRQIANKDYYVVPCLNDSLGFVRFLQDEVLSAFAK